MLIGEQPGDEEDLVGRCPVQLTALRGRLLRPGRAALIVSYQPAYLLRLPDPLRRAEARATLLEVLRAARELLDRGPPREDAPCGDGPGMPVAG